MWLAKTIVASNLMPIPTLSLDLRQKMKIFSAPTEINFRGEFLQDQRG